MWQHDAWDALRAPLVGARLLLTERSLWAPAALPVFLGLIWSLLSLGLAASTGMAGSIFVVLLSVTLAAALIGAIILVHLLLALCAPLFDWLSERSEAALGLQARPSGDSWLQRSLRGAAIGFRLFFLKLALLVVVLIVSFMPPVGTVVSWVLIGFTLSVDFLDYPMTRRRWSSAHKRAWLGRHWPAVLVFSLLIYLLLIIPGAGGLLLAPAIIGGTWLVCSRDRSAHASDNADRASGSHPAEACPAGRQPAAPHIDVSSQGPTYNIHSRDC